METELADAPITPTTRSGLRMIGCSPLEHRISDVSFWISAWTNVSDCSSAYVSREHVSRIRVPSVMLGSSSGSLLIWSSAYSMASIRWIPFSFLISPHAWPKGPLECTGKSPPSVMSPGILIECGCECWCAIKAGLTHTEKIHRRHDKVGERRLLQLGCSLSSNNINGGEWDAMTRLGFTASVHPRRKKPVNDRRNKMSCGFIFYYKSKTVVLCSLVFCHAIPIKH